jgi:hypothetical protein
MRAVNRSAFLVIVLPLCQVVLFAALMLVSGWVVFVLIRDRRARARSAVAKRNPLLIVDRDDWYV